MQDTDSFPQARAEVSAALRKYMKERNLSRGQLSSQIGVSPAILNALERGCAERLPHDSQLDSALRRLSETLGLPLPILKGAAGRPATARGWESAFWSTLSASQIRINLESGQGLLIYGFLLLALLYGLNLQQRRLAAANLLSLEPISPLPLSIQLSDIPVRLEDQGEVANPAMEFQPLARLEDPVIRRQLLREALQPLREPDHGVLEVSLAAPAQVTITRQGTVYAQLTADAGLLRWRLQPPFQVVMLPGGNGVVRWDDEPLSLVDEDRGLFRVEQEP